MIKRGDYVRVAEIINPKTNIVESMSGKVGKVKSSNSNGVVVEFNREKLPTQILFFTKELVKINPDFIFGKIKEILSDKKRFVTLKLKDIVSIHGGCMKHILEESSLTLPQKLVAVAAEVYNPVTIKQLNEIFVSQKGETFVKRAIERLEKMNLVHSKGNKVYPVVTLLPPPKEKGEKEEKTMLTEFDKDVMLFMRKIQELYIEKTVEASISKKGKKHVKNTVLWMNKVLKQKFDGTLSKESAYENYIQYCLGNLTGDNLKHLKRLTFAANRSSWVQRTIGRNQHRLDQFKPLMLDKSKITAAQYLGINRGAIPKEKDIKKSGYYTTAVIFFLSRLQHKRYPICTDVLYALEMLIAFKLYNRMEVKDLLDKHIIYANQYKKAKEMGKLDNLLEYSKTGKVKSYFCADCDKFDICNDQSREIKTCKEKEQIMVTPK